MRSKSIDFAWRGMKPRQAPKGESCALSPLETPKLCPRGKPMGKSFYYGFFFTARKIFSKPFLILLFLLAFWEFCIIIFQTPSYILPSPWAVLTALKQQRALLYFHTLPTFEELLFGFLFGASSCGSEEGAEIPSRVRCLSVCSSPSPVLSARRALGTAL